MRVLVVEDEKAIAKDLVQILREDGFVADWSCDGEDAFFRGANESFDAILLDLGLPAIDGKTILERWREAGITTPVIILTARDDWKDRVAAIDAGADDYVTKPFHKEEISARLRFVIRRSAGIAAANGALWFRDGILYGSTDKDVAAEFEIELTGATSMTAADFIL